MKFRGGFVLHVVCLGLIVAAWVLPWYLVQFIPDNPSDVFPHTERKFYFKEVVDQRVDEEEDPKTTTYSEIDADAVLATMDSCLSFLTIGFGIMLGAVIIELIVLIKFKSKKMGRVFKIFVVLVGVAAFVVLCVSFFTFLGITDSFNEDNFCGISILGQNFGGDTLYCKEFQGEEINTQVPLFHFTIKYGPASGWWCCLAAVVIALFGTGATFLSHR